MATEKRKTTSLVFDIPNIAFEIAAVNKPSGTSFVKQDELSGLCMHILLNRVQKFFRDHQPDYVVFAFENKNNWRKAWTASDESVAKIPYKGNRTYDSSMEYYFKMLDAFKETMAKHTSIICLTAEGLEGDDLIAGYCQLYASDDHEVTVLSGDKDFIQLLRNPNVKLKNQRDGKYRNQPGDKLYWEDLDYFIFEKCMRGDKKDNVFSALPNVRSTRLEKAFKDPYEYANLMNETWEIKDSNGNQDKVYRVGDLFEENKLLLDLTQQPEEIREYMFEVIKEEVNNLGTYSNFHLLKFLGQFELKKIIEEVHKFQDIFVRNSQTARGVLHVREVKPIVKSEDDKEEEIKKNSAFGF